MLCIPNERLQLWRDGNKLIRLKHQTHSCGITEDDQDAIHLTDIICGRIRQCYKYLQHFHNPKDKYEESDKTKTNTQHEARDPSQPPRQT